jgi:dTDP-4-dehydrorhamnose 3,5-epimerase
MINVSRFEIPGVLSFQYDVKEDNRGRSVGLFSKEQLRGIGIQTDFIEEILYSPRKAGTLYGIHFQNRPKPQTKMLRCVGGRGLDYAVDLRKDSATYKKWVCAELSAQNQKIMYVPAGFGHAFLSLEDNTDLLFWIDNYFNPGLSQSIRYDDPELNIQYPIKNPILSEQDKNAKVLDETEIDL